MRNAHNSYTEHKIIQIPKRFLRCVNVCQPKQESWQGVCFLCVPGVNHEPSMCGEVATSNVTRVTNSECWNMIIIFHKSSALLVTGKSNLITVTCFNVRHCTQHRYSLPVELRTRISLQIIGGDGDGGVAPKPVSSPVLAAIKVAVRIKAWMCRFFMALEHLMVATQPDPASTSINTLCWSLHHRNNASRE